MATLNFIMPENLKEGFCARQPKQNKIKHSWLPSGRTRALPEGNVAVECYCKHCNEREWSTVTQTQFIMLTEQWRELS